MAEKEKAKRNLPGADYPCGVCGSKDYSWGRINKQNGHFAETLIYYDTSDTENLWEQITTGRHAVARTCEVCGNVQLFVLPLRNANSAQAASEDDPLKDLFED